MAAAARKHFVGGNWKCNKTLAEVSELAAGISACLTGGVDVMVSPSPLYLPAVLANASNGLIVSSQNVSATGFGAFTGEIAPEQLLDIGVQWTIIGHSERRKYYGEIDEVVTTKVKQALEKGLSVVACFGETKAQRDAGETDHVVLTQLGAIVRGATGHFDRLVLAYEPVWAIGTGLTCDGDEAQRVCALLRNNLKHVSFEVANNTRIIYGGSVKPNNCQGLIAKPDIDGFLVGGASLSVEKFAPIINSAKPSGKL